MLNANLTLHLTVTQSSDVPTGKKLKMHGDLTYDKLLRNFSLGLFWRGHENSAVERAWQKVLSSMAINGIP